MKRSQGRRLMSKNRVEKKYRKQLKESFERIYDIHNLVKRECAIKDEAEKFKDFITPHRYKELLAIYCENKGKGSIYERFLQDKRVSYVFNLVNARSAIVLSILTFLVQQYFQHQTAADQYKQSALTKYIDETKELLIKKNEANEKDSKTLLANVRTISTLQLLDGKRKEILVNFLIKSKLLDIDNKSVPIHVSLSQANLQNIDLVKADLSGADLSGADLSGADLSGADLSGADLTRANLRKASLRYAALDNAKLQSADLTGTRFREANLEQADLKNSSLSETNLVGASLKKADLRNASLNQAELVGANLSESKLGGSRIIGSNLMNANLTKSNFECSILISDDLTNSNLENVNFKIAYFKNQNLTNLIDAKAQNGDFTNAKLEQIDFQNTFKSLTQFQKNDLFWNKDNQWSFYGNTILLSTTNSQQGKCKRGKSLNQKQSTMSSSQELSNSINEFMGEIKTRFFSLIHPISLEKFDMVNEDLEKINKTQKTNGKPDFSCGPYAQTYVILEKNITGQYEFIGVQCILPTVIPKDAKQKSTNKTNRPNKKYFYNFVWYGEHIYPFREYNHFQHYVGQSYFTKPIKINESKKNKYINSSDLQSIKSSEGIVYDEEQLDQGIKNQKDPVVMLKFRKIEDYIEKKIRNKIGDKKDDLSGFYPKKFQVEVTFIKDNKKKNWTEYWILKEYLKEQLKDEKQQKKFSEFSLSPHNVTSCGTLFSEYKVYPLLPRIIHKPSYWARLTNPNASLWNRLTNHNDSLTDRGLRCVFNGNGKMKSSIKSDVITWFGSGVWEGKQYYHLGTYLEKGQGSADLCFSEDWYCYYVQSGYLDVSPVDDKDLDDKDPKRDAGYNVRKEWLENWRK
jgi:uncharacterized protein YjbI with pentapeptide repeats